MHFRHLILLHTQMSDGFRRLPTVRDWPAEFGPYAPGYQPRSDKSRVPTQANHELRPSHVLELKEGKEARIATKKKRAIPKRHSISAIRDFPSIPGRFNPHLSDERRRAMQTHLTQVSEEYARMELEEIRLLKAGALPEGSSRQRTAFLDRISKDYEALVKEEEDSSKDSSEE